MIIIVIINNMTTMTVCTMIVCTILSRKIEFRSKIFYNLQTHVLIRGSTDNKERNQRHSGYNHTYGTYTESRTDRCLYSYTKVTDRLYFDIAYIVTDSVFLKCFQPLIILLKRSRLLM